MEQTVNYRGIEIEVIHDTVPRNPWEDWDGCMPLITESGSWGSTKDYSEGDIDRYLSDYLSYNQVKRHQRKIVEVLRLDYEEEKKYMQGDDFTEYLQDQIYEFVREDIENKVAFCEAFNIKHYSGTSRGYSQGDWTEVFFCWTPEFEEVTGRSYQSIGDSDFEAADNLFGYWAWGDVYGLNIEELGESCWGFYGDDLEKSGLLDHARGIIDYHLEHQWKVRLTKLKDLIRNSVPLFKRQEILNLSI